MSTVFHGYWNESHPSAGEELADWVPASIATYELDVYAYNLGTLTAGDADNLGVYLNSDLIARIPSPAAVNLIPNKVTVFVIAGDVTDHIKVKTISSSGILSTYRGLTVGRLAAF